MQKRKRKSVVYVVHWPEIGVMKAGISEQKRWRKFVELGAVVIDLIEFDNYLDASAFETVVHKGMRPNGYAFNTAAEAEPYLGGKGGGYCECFRVPPGQTVMEFLRSVDWLAL